MAFYDRLECLLSLTITPLTAAERSERKTKVYDSISSKNNWKRFKCFLVEHFWWWVQPHCCLYLWECNLDCKKWDIVKIQIPNSSWITNYSSCAKIDTISLNLFYISCLYYCHSDHTANRPPSGKKDQTFCPVNEKLSFESRLTIFRYSTGAL